MMATTAAFASNDISIRHVGNRHAHIADCSKTDTADFSPASARSVRDFHRRFDDYAPTPLVPLKDLARSLGITSLWIKDESPRFGLNAFKVLGASHAMARFMAEKLELRLEEVSFDFLRSSRMKERVGEFTFVTATDGNHGRAVAWAARQLGQKAVVYLPQGSAGARVMAIRSLGAEAIVTKVNYDESVRHAEGMARRHDWVLLQDTAWPGYERIPLWIMQGYLTMYAEAFEQLGENKPTHVFIQAGVGSLAATLQAYLRERYRDDWPFFTIVEPTNAACFYKSAKAANGLAITVPGELDTIMAGLAAGKPSELAWPILRDYSDSFFACSDAVAVKGMRVLANPVGADRRVVSGEAGAVTIGLIVCLCSDSKLRKTARDIDIGPDSRVLLFSTEGATNPDRYRRLVLDTSPITTDTS